jgi:SAM-dependent methyltransferase
MSAACRSCGSTGLRPFLDLGETPLADRLLSPARADRPEPRFPLRVAMCPECSLVQLLESAPPEQLFADEYPYYSSFSDALLRHSRENAEGLIASRRLGPESLVVELASNDGYLLRNFVDHGVPVLGIDPADGPAAVAIASGVPTTVAFFTQALANDLRAAGRQADVIIANNVMAHVPDLNGFVSGMERLLAPDGIVSVENPYVRPLVEECQFDTIYHEHHCYFSCTAVDTLMVRHGLHLNDVVPFPGLHGGTLRWLCSRNPERSERAAAYLEAERRDGVTDPAFYAAFADRVASVRQRLRAVLEDLRAQGCSVAGYGAAAKGATLLNHVGIGTDLVEYVVDRNVHKHGCLMPGTRQPILPVETLLERRPDVVLLLAWNFAEEIARQQAPYLDGGGRFLVPVPEPRFR